MSASPPEGEEDDEKEQNSSHQEKSGKGRRGHHLHDQHMKTAMYLKREIHFTVESPDGEQMPVRYKADMMVSSLFQTACKKFHLNPYDHFLVINNREMDMRDTLRKFNITQNAVVKMYKGNKMSAGPNVFVSVRIRDCRIGSVFRQTDNLWDIVSKLLSSSSIEPGMVPIVIYLKTELIGESVLKQVRLRDMGITQGSVIMRFLQLKQEDLDQRKMKEDEDTMATLESLELKAAGPTTDAGLRSVHFRLSEDELYADNIQFIGERKALAFRLPPIESPEERVQQDYFDLLVEEIGSLFNEVSRKKPSAPKIDLMDTVRSELKKLKEIRSDYDDVIVRIQFPDRMCLQFLVLPEEHVSDIKEFMKKFLRDPNAEFELTMPHTKQVADEHATLVDLKMVPVGRFFFLPKDVKFDSSEQYLADEFILASVPYGVGKEAALMLRGESLENFLLADSERDSGMMRKSTGGFLSKFVRSSHSSGRASSTREPGGSRSKSVWVKKQSSFQPRSWSRGSSMRGSDDDDDDDDSYHSIKRSVPHQSNGESASNKSIHYNRQTSLSNDRENSGDDDERGVSPRSKRKSSISTGSQDRVNRPGSRKASQDRAARSSRAASRASAIRKKSSNNGK